MKSPGEVACAILARLYPGPGSRESIPGRNLADPEGDTLGIKQMTVGGMDRQIQLLIQFDRAIAGDMDLEAAGAEAVAEQISGIAQPFDHLALEADPEMAAIAGQRNMLGADPDGDRTGGQPGRYPGRAG